VITPEYCRVMAGYNAEMNHRVYAAAERLDDGARREQAGAFWTSVHGTLSHILWADRLWLARFADGPKPHVDMGSSDRMYDDFAELKAQREETDAFMRRWAATVREDWLGTEMAWFSAVLQREVRAPVRLLVTHFFNHQTHHRGQAHALLTRAGEAVGDTDLFLVVPMEQFA
jgi:uncharacterized damage-inducible protein DinB